MRGNGKAHPGEIGNEVESVKNLMNLKRAILSKYEPFTFISAQTPRSGARLDLLDPNAASLVWVA